MKKIKKCNNCNKILPFDSSFCQYCGSDSISEIEEKNTLICKRCGSALPYDSKFCQYCGSDEVEENQEYYDSSSPQQDNLTKGAKQKTYKLWMIISLLLSCFFLILTIYYRTSYNDICDAYNDSSNDIENLESTISELQKKSDKYDEVVKYARRTRGDESFFARKTVLYKPIKAMVWIYFSPNKNGTITCNADSDVDISWGDWKGDWIPLYVTYNGGEIKNIQITNDVNTEVINIMVIGD